MTHYFLKERVVVSYQFMVVKADGLAVSMYGYTFRFIDYKLVVGDNPIEVFKAFVDMDDNAFWAQLNTGEWDVRYLIEGMLQAFADLANDHALGACATHSYGFEHTKRSANHCCNFGSHFLVDVGGF